MKVPAIKLQNQVGHYLEAALTEPVIIEQTGKPMTVMISYADYERFLAIEDAFWAKKALEAEAKGHFFGETSLDELMRIKELKDKTAEKRDSIRFVTLFF